MNMNLLRAGAASCALVSAIAITAPALSQQAQPPQKSYYIGEGQVDLWRGVFTYSNTDISVGGEEAEGGLSLQRFAGVRSVGPGAFGHGTAHNFEIAVYREQFVEEGHAPTQHSYRFHVLTGRTTLVFERIYPSTQTSWATLWGGTFTISGLTGPYTYTHGDGTVFSFGTLQGCPQIGIPSVNCAVGNSIVSPNGLTTTFTYDTDGSSWKRLRLVTNNRGWGLGFNYHATDFRNLIRVCALNLTVDVPTGSTPCPGSPPAATYAYTGPNSFYLSGYTDPAGQTTGYTYNPTFWAIATITNPGSTSPDLTNNYNATSQKLTSQVYANGATWSYAYESNVDWDTNPGNDWTDVTDPLSHVTRHTFLNSTGPGAPASVRDPLNRTTSFLYHDGAAQHLQRRTEPEGNYVHNTYDGRYNITETRRVMKTGPGAGDIATSAIFPATCTNIVTCNQPTSRTDGRGYRTDYTYNSTHGGLLTETAPAPAGSTPVGSGTRPQRRLTYAQRYAWIKTSGGSYVQAATPVWVVTQESRCITGAPHVSGTGCALANDEVITSYDYGPNSGPNNLLLRGVVVTGPTGTGSGTVTSRTCYSYDARGNRISETGPGAALSSCP